MKKLSRSTLRWYIGTKCVMPIVDIRRRFGIEGEDVTILEDEQGKLYAGLPQHAAEALEELRRQGKIGYEVSVDLNARVLLGAYVIMKKGRDHQSGQEAAPDGSENAA